MLLELSLGLGFIFRIQVASEPAGVLSAFVGFALCHRRTPPAWFGIVLFVVMFVFMILFALLTPKLSDFEL